MKQIYFLLCLLSVLLYSACSEDHGAAKQHLANARNYLAQQDFEKAKAEIDSINIRYPKSFEQRKQGLAFLDTIRHQENDYIIADVDKQIGELEPFVEQLKTKFVFEKNEKYQETGLYTPKSIAGNKVLTATTLNAGVEEDGRICLVSVYIGGQKHDQLKLTTSSAEIETPVIVGDGYVYRFSDLGKNYEIIRLIGENENGLAKFIAENAKENIKIHLIGKQTTSYNLSQNVKNAIAQSYELSTQILLVDSLKQEKEKAQFRNFYLDNGKRTEIPVTNDNLVGVE